MVRVPRLAISCARTLKMNDFPKLVEDGRVLQQPARCVAPGL